MIHGVEPTRADDVVQIRGDDFTYTFLLPTTGPDGPIDWSGSTWTVSSNDLPSDADPFTAEVDLEADPPTLTVGLSAASTDAAPMNTRWYLSEDIVFGRTFLTQKVIFEVRE